MLKKLLLDEKWQFSENLGACYVVPPIGSFLEHQTGCSVGRGRIAGLWGVEGVQEGTRVTQPATQVPRRLATFGWKKEPDYLSAPFHLPSQLPGLRWLTEPPPADADVSLSPFGVGGVWASGEPPAAPAAVSHIREQLWHGAFPCLLPCTSTRAHACFHAHIRLLPLPHLRLQLHRWQMRRLG